MKVDEIQIYEDVYSPLKASYHKNDLAKIMNGEMIPPKFLMIHPEGFCNNDCFFCAYRASGWSKKGMNFMRPEWTTEQDRQVGQLGRPRGELVPEKSGLPKKVALSLPNQMAEEGIPSCEITGSGEPTLYPHIKELFNGFKKHDIETALVTHGQNLKPLLDSNCLGNLQWLRFSIDASTPETHAKVHAVSPVLFNHVKENVSRAIDLYPDAVIGVSFVVTALNYREIVSATKLWKEVGVNNIRFSFEYEPSGTAHLTKEQTDKIQGLITEAHDHADNSFKVFGQINRLDTYNKPNDDFSYCGYQQFSWNIGYDAKCYPCCIQIYYDDYAYGDLTKQSLHDIIYGDFRKKYLEEFDVKKCNSCWLRNRNIAIETLIAPEKRLGHVNYV